MKKLYLKFGVKALFRNPFRAIVSMLLIVVSVGFLGVTLIYDDYDLVSWERYLYGECIDDKYMALAFTKNTHLEDISGIEPTTSEQAAEVEEKLKAIGGGYCYYLDSSQAGLNNYGLNTGIGLYRLSDYFCEARSASQIYEGDIFAPYSPPYEGEDEEYAYSALKGDRVYNKFMRAPLVWYDSEETLAEFGYTLYGALPQTSRQIAIPQWLLNSFMCYGYQDENGVKQEITCAEDIMGKTLQLCGELFGPITATIVGVIEMDYEAEDYTKYLNFSKSEFVDFEECSPLFGVAVAKSYFDTVRRNNNYYLSCFLVLRDNGHFNEYFDLAMAWQFDLTAYEAINEFYDVHLAYWDGWRFSYIYNAFVLVYQNNILPLKGFLSVIPLLLVFSGVLLVYFVVSTVVFKQKSLGVMRSLGSSKKQLFFSFLIPLLIFCVLCGVMAFALQIVFVSRLNGDFMAYTAQFIAKHGEIFSTADILSGAKYLYAVSPRVYLFTFLFPAAVMLFTLAITAYIMFRKPVIANLNKKQFTLFKSKAKQ